MCLFWSSRVCVHTDRPHRVPRSRARQAKLTRNFECDRAFCYNTHTNARSIIIIIIVVVVVVILLMNRLAYRPGVAITTSGRSRSSASCDFCDSPPTTRQLVMSVKRERRCTIECVCAASSRVGLSTSTYR